MNRINIPSGEHRMIRVLAVSRPIPQMSSALRSRPKEAVAAELLGFSVASGTIDLFPVSDLADIGLPAYLADGYDIAPDDMVADRTRLEALDGYVLIVFSKAFAGAAATFETGADLTLIGTYAEASPNMSAPPIDSEAAQPYSGVPGMTPPVPPGNRAGGAMIGLGIVVGLVLLLVWIVR